MKTKHNDYRCPVCGSSKLSKLEFETWTSRIRESGGLLWRCQSCRLIFSIPPPAVDYNEDFYRMKEPLGGSAGGDVEPRVHIIERLNSVEKYFKSRRPLSILDVGCSAGVFLEYAKKRGHNVKGVEISRYSANIAISKGLDVFIGDVKDADIPFKSIDFIHMNHVLEHLADPLSTLRFVKHLLAQDGVIVAEVPNEFENISYKIRRHLKPSSLIRIVPTQHSCFFDPKSLSYLFNLAGYKIVRLSTPSRTKTSNPVIQIMTYCRDRLLLGWNVEAWAKSRT